MPADTPPKPLIRFHPGHSPTTDTCATSRDTPIESRYPLLNEQLQAHATRIIAERDNGDIVAYACAVSAVPTVAQEIWLASGELEAFAIHHGITLSCVEDVLGEQPHDLPTPDGMPASHSPDTFDWLHIALEYLVNGTTAG